MINPCMYYFATTMKLDEINIFIKKVDLIQFHWIHVFTEPWHDPVLQVTAATPAELFSEELFNEWKRLK